MKAIDLLEAVHDTSVLAGLPREFTENISGEQFENDDKRANPLSLQHDLDCVERMLNDLAGNAGALKCHRHVQGAVLQSRDCITANNQHEPPPR
jgi:hypothetical protein